MHPAPLLLQDLVEPRLLEHSTAEVRVRSAHNGRRLAFLLEWFDPGADDRPGAARFIDACAVQLPAQPVPDDVPAPQMGEPGKAVEIVYWSAAWQAVVDGRADDIQALYPGAAVDHYPFEAPSLSPGSRAQKELESLYAPARALGNRMSGPRDRPVQDLRAEGPGTLEPVADDTSQGEGRRLDGKWLVRLERRFPAQLSPGDRTQIAFAVWQGSNDEVGARKMRSGWIPLFLEERL
jgi:hypothetical protein